MKRRRPILSPRRAQGSGQSEPSLPEAALPQLLTVNDFLRIFSISRTSFYREVNSGRLKIVKFGTATRISRAEAEAWLQRLTPVTPAEGVTMLGRDRLSGRSSQRTVRG